MNKNFKLILILALMLNAGSLFAQPSGWSYMKAFTVTENSASSLYNYQVRLEINTGILVAAGQMEASGADIRFGKDCQGLTLFNYWIESGMNTANTIIWIQVDTLTAGSSTNIFMYYGNPTAGAASALSVFNGPNSATDSVTGGSLGGVENSQRGFRFSPTEDILIASFGKYEPNGTDRIVTLFKVSTQGIMNQTTVTGPDSVYNYAALTNPFWIKADTQYILTLFQGIGDGYFYGASPQMGQHMIFYDMRYCNTCDQNTFPTDYLDGMHYGFPDLHYYTRQHVTPEPTIVPATNLVSIDPQDINACEGVSFQLNAQLQNNDGAPYTYQWSPALYLDDSTLANPTALVLSDITFSVLIADRYHCYVFDSMHVSVHDIPVTVLNAPDTFMCINEPAVTLSGSPLGGILSGNGIVGSTFDPAVAGQGIHNIFYAYTDTNGCVGLDSSFVEVSLCAGVAEAEKDWNIKISPNPGSGVFTLDLPEIQEVEITLMDPSGKQFLRKNSLNDKTISLDLEDIAAGVYFLKVKGAQQEKTLRLIVK